MKPYVIVAGLGRCGSSLVMQMLAAGGVPCIGRAPDYEVPGKIDVGTVDAAFLYQHREHAFKLLGPHECRLPPIFATAIWLERDPTEQAKSQAKFLEFQAGVQRPNRKEVRGLRALLRRDAARGMAALRSFPLEVLHFEDILEQPLESAKTICERLEPWWPQIEPAVMAAIVKKRSPECAPGLDIEAEALAKARGCAQ